ncbi:hypothetical protein IQ259_18645 [Fortiea sp. LEGE XX443]|uniref:hypothetical protein n=1 Tax=Fortiea sp. LEGE XX443 TaxID=1828611 RepID=UPI001880B5E8|nr:hypothetical protein [Fortiea sp. LEGE XX443]MBE9007031.1 hypothetical protein [Fortiea sp. LEGE XX443]
MSNPLLSIIIPTYNRPHLLPYALPTSFFTIVKRLFHKPRISRDTLLRQVNFDRLIQKHKSLLLQHPQTFAQFLYEHAVRSSELGQKSAALSTLLWAMQLAPREILRHVMRHYKNKLLKYATKAIAQP